jgi:NAD+ kinase
LSPEADMIGILRHRLVTSDVACLERAREVAEQAGLRVWQVERGSPAASYRNHMARTRLLLTVGGDGTLLLGAKLAAPRAIPLLGINLGRLGFLTELEATQVGEGLERFLAGSYWLDERTLLEAAVHRGGRQVLRELGLNEAVIERGSIGKLLRLQATVDGQAVGTFDADGVITATATGSTAYSLAAGGPILEPSVEGLVLVPMNPFALTVRPIVFPPRQALTIELPRHNARLSVDGGTVHRLHQGDHVRMAAHERPVRFVRFTDRARFYTLLREKIGWGLPLVPTVKRV